MTHSLGTSETHVGREIMRVEMVPDVAAEYGLKELAGDAGKTHGSIVRHITLGPFLKDWGDPC